MSQRRQWTVWLVALLLLLLGSKLLQDYRRRAETHTRDYTWFLGELAQDKIETVQALDDGRLLLVTVPGGEDPVRVFGPADLQVLSADVERVKPPGSKVRFEYPPPSPFKDAGRYLAGSLPIVLVVLLIYVAFIRQLGQSSNQALAFSRSRARRLTDGQPRKTFDDVAGADEAVEELREVVDFLRHSDRYRRLGAEIPKGVLLMGPPGCGKTLLARAVAGEADVPFFHISGSDFVEMFVGVGASRVRDLFEQAKANRPCIVFIDELDAVGRHRGAGLGGGHDEREQTVNQLLVEMDGFETNSGVIVMAATNRPDILDPALLRPGRFDRRVVVDHPDVRGRREILELYVRMRPVASDVDPDVLARQTPGLTGADLYSVVNEASILAARMGRELITMLDFEEAIQRVVSGRERRSRVLLPDERRAVAYHEAGHAIVAHFTEHCTPVHKISILPRGMSLGYVMTLPDEERHNPTLAELRASMAHLLGGRVAEEIVYGREGITTGAKSDLEQVTRLAHSMVCEYGMTESLGPRTLGHRTGPIFLGRDLVQERDYSEEMARAIDQEIGRLISEAYETARRVVTAHRDLLEKLVEVLLTKETLGADELREVLGERAVRSAEVRQA